MFLVAILSSMRPGGGDALQRAYRSAWRRNPEKRGDVEFLAQHLKDASVPGAYLGTVPRPIAGALRDWSKLIPPKKMKHRTGYRLLS